LWPGVFCTINVTHRGHRAKPKWEKKYIKAYAIIMVVGLLVAGSGCVSTMTRLCHQFTGGREPVSAAGVGTEAWCKREMDWTYRRLCAL